MMNSRSDSSSPLTVSPEQPGSPGANKATGPFPRLFACAALAGIVCLAGCRDKDTIRSYTISKETTPAQTAGDQATHERAVIAYDVPQGWQNIRDDKPMRFATLRASDGDKQLEVSIIPLGGGAGGVAANVQRWRGQLGLGQATEEELAKEITTIEGRDGTKGLLVDMAGPGPEGSALGPQRMLAAIFMHGDTSWFIKTMDNADFIARYHDPFVKLCKSVHFEGGGSGSGMTGGAGMGMSAAQTPPQGAEPVVRLPHWNIPKGWEKEAQPQPFSVVSFNVKRDGAEAIMTVSPLSSAPQLLGNINRWRRQLGLAPVERPEDSSTPVTISGDQGVMVDLEGQGERTLGVILPHAGTTWFFKLKGPSAVMAAEKDNFESFIQSIHFVEDASGE